jgi:hypothetical protein
MRSQTAWWLLASALVGSGCSAAPEVAQTDASTVGELSIGIELGNSGVEKVDYVITGSGGFSKVGSIDVSQSSQIATRIGALPAATAYTVVLSAETTEPPSTCTGSATFDVTPGETTPVDVTLQCVEINADLNTCPVIDGLSTLPNQVALGGVITLSGEVHDPDLGPSPVSYDWTTTTGALSTSGAGATLTCSTDGTATVTLTVRDGGPDCVSAQSVTVICGDASPPVAQAAPLPSPFVALLGAQLLALGGYLSGRRRKRAA